MIHVIVIQPFDCPVTVAIDRKAYCKHFPVALEEISHAEALCQEFHDGGGGTGFGMLLLKRYNVKIVHHESLHLAHMIMEAHGLNVNAGRSSSEMQCYLQTHIVKEIKKVCYPKKTKKKTKS